MSHHYPTNDPASSFSDPAELQEEIYVSSHEIYGEVDHQEGNKLHEDGGEGEDKHDALVLPTVGQAYEGTLPADKYDHDPHSHIAQLEQERAELVARRRQTTNCVTGVIQKVIPYGSIPASAFNLASSTIGAGIISLPSAWESSGVSMAVVYSVIFYAMTVYSIYCLGKAGEATGIRNYPKNVEILLGPFAGYLLAVILFISSFSAQISYVISLHDIMIAFLDDASYTPPYLRTTSGQRLITAMIWLVTMLPLCIPKEVNSLRYFSTIAVCIIVYFVITMIIHSCQNGMKTGVYKEMVMFQTGNTAIAGISLFMFAFGCQLNVYEVFGELHKPTVKRLTITSFVASGGCFILYMLSGVFGYMDFGSAVTGSALKLYNPVKSPMMGVGYAGLMLKLAVGFGMHNIPVRECTYHVFGLQTRTLAYWKHVLIVTFLALCSLIFGLFIPRVNIVFGISGGFCGGFDGFVFPGLMYMYAGGFTLKSVGWGRYLATYYMVVAGSICIVWGTAGTVYSEVANW